MRVVLSAIDGSTVYNVDMWKFYPVLTQFSFSLAVLTILKYHYIPDSALVTKIELMTDDTKTLDFYELNDGYEGGNWTIGEVIKRLATSEDYADAEMMPRPKIEFTTVDKRTVEENNDDF